jgi:5-methyltetrahydrofolate--homocysteine methyltransferase
MEQLEALPAIAEAVVRGDAKTVQGTTRELISAGVDAHTILNDGLLAGMSVVAERFKTGKVYVPEVLVSARAMNFGLKELEPLLSGSEVGWRGTVLLGTVKGDIHDIGKNIVGMMLKGSGYRIIDLGVDKSPQQFADAVAEHHPDVLGLSALLSTTMKFLQPTIDAVKASPQSNGVKIIVGGAPVTREFAESIHADGYAKDAGAAVGEIRRILGQN